MDANYKMFKTISKHVIQSAMALKVLIEGQGSLADMVVDNHLAWDSLLAKQWGVCFLNGTTCCMWIKNTGKVTQIAQQIRQQVKVVNITQMTFKLWSFIQNIKNTLVSIFKCTIQWH